MPRLVLLQLGNKDIGRWLGFTETLIAWMGPSSAEPGGSPRVFSCVSHASDAMTRFEMRCLPWLASVMLRLTPQAPQALEVEGEVTS